SVSATSSVLSNVNLPSAFRCVTPCLRASVVDSGSALLSCVSRDDDRISRLQLDIVVTSLGPNHLVIVEAQAYLAAILIAQHVNSFLIGKILQAAGFSNDLQYGAGAVDPVRSFAAYLPDHK